MDGFRRHRNAIVNVGALVLPLGVAGLLVPFRSSFANTAAALVLVAVVVAIAVIGDRTAGFLATVSATVWFDFFLTQPFERLQITHRPDIETAVSLFVVGIVVTELAARSRHHHDAATEQSDYVGLIYGLSELAASGAPALDVIERARTELVGLLHLRSCRYESGRSERAMLRIEHDGQVMIGDRAWGVDQMGLPGPEIELLVQGRGETLGRFVLRPTPGRPVSRQRRVVAIALADQVGSVLTPRLRSARRAAVPG
jgi:K+-sensing histidine kinase KdpD